MKPIDVEVTNWDPEGKYEGWTVEELKAELAGHEEDK